MTSLKQLSLRGIRWSAFSQLLGQSAQYGSFIVLTRLLAPEDFGTIASAGLAIGFVAVLNELGLGAALIQRAELRPGHLNACFWSNMVMGLALWGLISLLAPFIAAFFHNPEIAPVMAWLALSFPLVALSVVPKALMEKRLRFKALAFAESGAALVNGGLAIGLALSGFGVWSLVAGTLAGYVIQAIAMGSLCRWVPRGSFSRLELKELFGFGLNVLGTRMVNYFNANIDYLIIGRLLGPAALGVYSLAYKLVTWPMLKVSHVTLRVVFPAFSRIQHDDAALRRHYGLLVGTLALIIFPLLAGLALLAPELIPLVFGEKWRAAVLPTQILCITGGFKAMVCSIGTLFLSKGRPDLELKLNLLGSVLLTSFILIGVRWGVVGVACALVGSSLIGAPLQQAIANRLIGMRMRDYLRVLWVPACATAVMGVALVALRGLFGSQGLPDGLLLAAALPLSVGVYLSALSALGVDYKGLLGTIAGRRPKEAVLPSSP